MYLKRLELVGFKSFADKTELAFGPGITAVVGPNGSGKSNIADAIRWVLGEHSARELRGAQMADVIFAGSEHKKAVGYAQVSLVMDNSDGKLPVQFTEVMVTRRVDRAGEGEYLINQVPCRLKDILELFLDTGVGKENYSVIGQGRIDEILLTKPEDRRAIFEEAAGIARYKQRKREASRKLAETEQNLLRLGDLVADLESRLGDLSVQAEKATRYRELSGELGELEIGLSAHQLRQSGADLQTWQIKARELRAKLQETELNLQDTEGALEVARQLTGALEQEAGLLQAQLVETTARLERAEGQVNLSHQQAQQAESDDGRLAGEVAGLQERLRSLQADLTRVREQATTVTAALAEVRRDLAGRELGQTELQTTLAGVARTADALKEQAFDLTKRAAEKRNLVLAEGKSREQVRQRLARLDQEGTEAGQAAGLAREAQAASAGRLQDLAARRSELETAAAGSRAREEQAALAMQQAGDAMARLRERIEATSSKLALLEDLKAAGEGFQKGTRTVLQARENNRAWARGVLGAMAEVVRTEPRYERAIETALGAGMQNIVTDTDQAAKACIAELKRTGSGRATFLPLNIIRPNSFRADELRELQSEPGVLGVAIDLCRFAERFRPAVANLLGRIAVAENMDAALAVGRKTGFRHRVVTLDGEVLSAGGALTGGSVEGRSTGLLSRERERAELAEALPRLREELAAARQQHEVARGAHQAATTARVEQEKAMQELDLAATATRGELERHRLELQRCEQVQRNLEAEVTAMSGQMRGGEATVQALLAEAEQLEQEQAAVVAQVARLQEEGRTLQDQTEAAARAVTELRVRQAELAQEERSLADQQERLAAEATRAETAECERMAAQDLVVARREQLARELAAAVAEAREAGRVRTELLEQQQALQARRVSAQEQAVQKEREIRGLRRSQTEITSQLTHAEVEEARLQTELQNLADRLQGSHGLSPAQVAGRELPEPELPRARQRAMALRDLIRDLGPVNLGAIDEHQQAMERLSFFSGQRADLEEAKASLYRAIQELDKRMRHHFLEAFGTIRHEFQRVYQELFEGGKADLVLLDDQDLLETGVDIVVAPPGKKMTPLSLLSGGERAMTAIALLFALLRVKPSPFVVLDEVEAALDEANVERVGRYLKQYSQGTQFVCITHQRGTMEVADALYGVTMEGTGMSRIVSVRFTDVHEPLAG